MVKDNLGQMLNEPLSISGLLNKGAQFQINTNFDNFTEEFFDAEDNVGSDDENEEIREIIISPWEKNFSELRQLMVKVNDDIFKRVVKKGIARNEPIPQFARVAIQYNAYWEGEKAPFDSSFMRGKPHRFSLDMGEALQGIEEAVKTMEIHEESQFVISYRLLFGEMGCPPRIKPKGDGLYIINLVNFVDVGDDNATNAIAQENKNKFVVVFDKVKQVHASGINHFKLGNVSSACKSFHKAVEALEFCQLQNQEEQNIQQNFLVKLYLNLAVCYNRMNLPRKTCCMIKEINKISDISKNCKALFQEGRALLMIGDYQSAKKKLTQAQRLNPNNGEINNELKILEKKYAEYTQNSKSIWQKALGLYKDSVDGNIDEHNKSVFKQQIGIILEKFKHESGSRHLALPDGLTSEEISCVDSLTEEFGLKLIISQSSESKSYAITKI